MKIPKAIEILSLDLDHTYVNHYDDFQDAIKLGIEALVRIRYQRIKPTVPHKTLLPSETQETTPTRSLHHIKAVLESPLGKEPKG